MLLYSDINILTLFVKGLVLKILVTVLKYWLVEFYSYYIQTVILAIKIWREFGLQIDIGLEGLLIQLYTGRFQYCWLFNVCMESCRLLCMRVLKVLPYKVQKTNSYFSAQINLFIF